MINTKTPGALKKILYPFLFLCPLAQHNQHKTFLPGILKNHVGYVAHVG